MSFFFSPSVASLKNTIALLETQLEEEANRRIQLEKELRESKKQCRDLEHENVSLSQELNELKFLLWGHAETSSAGDPPSSSPVSELSLDSFGNNMEFYSTPDAPLNNLETSSIPDFCENSNEEFHQGYHQPPLGNPPIENFNNRTLEIMKEEFQQELERLQGDFTDIHLLHWRIKEILGYSGPDVIPKIVMKNEDGIWKDTVSGKVVFDPNCPSKISFLIHQSLNVTWNKFLKKEGGSKVGTGELNRYKGSLKNEDPYVAEGYTLSGVKGPLTVWIVYSKANPFFVSHANKKRKVEAPPTPIDDTILSNAEKGMAGTAAVAVVASAAKLAADALAAGAVIHGTSTAVSFAAVGAAPSVMAGTAAAATTFAGAALIAPVALVGGIVAMGALSWRYWRSIGKKEEKENQD